MSRGERKMAETITSTETARDTFYAYRTDEEGPFIVSLAIYSHVADTGREIHDSFRVTVNSEDRWGGFAHHLPENGPEGLGKFVRWTDPMTTSPAPQSTEMFAVYAGVADGTYSQYAVFGEADARQAVIFGKGNIRAVGESGRTITYQNAQAMTTDPTTAPTPSNLDRRNTNRFRSLTDREVEILHQALHVYRCDPTLDTARNEEARKLQVELEDSF